MFAYTNYIGGLNNKGEVKTKGPVTKTNKIKTNFIKRCDPISKLPKAPEGYININCHDFTKDNILNISSYVDDLSFFKNSPLNKDNGLKNDNNVNMYELSAHYIKDALGNIFENIWHSSKVFKNITTQFELKDGKVFWSQNEENHITNGYPNEKYWMWRDKLLRNENAIRYPNGYYNKDKYEYVLVFDPYYNPYCFDYITARKQVYCKLYANLIQNTKAFYILYHLYKMGYSLQLCDLDSKNIELNEDTLRSILNDKNVPFGPSYVLAICILGLTHLFDE